MTPEPSRPPPAVATLAMLVLLLLSVGAAWLMVRYYRSPSREGALIIQEMRSQKLSRLWPHRPYAVWFARKDPAGRVEAGLSVLRRPADGGFEGKKVGLVPAGLSLRTEDVETWFVSDDLARGEADYETLKYRVTISLEGGRVTLTGHEVDTVTMDAPANYLPEGLKWLAARMVAASGRKAVFTVIDADASVMNKTIVLTYATMTPVGPREVRCRYEQGGPRPAGWTYHLDGSGEVVRIEWEDGRVLAPAPAPAEEEPEEPAEEKPAESIDSGPFWGDHFTGWRFFARSSSARRMSSSSAGRTSFSIL